MPKIAITGKGGVGKSTLASLMAYVYASRGHRVLAVDADPDGNLAAALGVPPDVARQITPIAEMEELIAERTGAQPGSYGVFFKMNPRVDDLPDRFALEHRGVRLLVMGTIDRGGSGCVCPESVLLKNLVTHLLLYRDEVLIMDMEAGVEHLGRGTAQAVDAMLVVVEPGRRSIQTADAVRRLASDLGIARIYAVGNKIRDEDDRRFVEARLAEIQMQPLGFLPFASEAIEADREGMAVFDKAPQLVRATEGIIDRLDL